LVKELKDFLLLATGGDVVEVGTGPAVRLVLTTLLEDL
jgi:hypothetical protein